MNSAGKDGASGAIRGALSEQFADRDLPGEEPSSQVDAKTAAAHARLIAGTYDNSRRSESNVLSVFGLPGPAKVTVNPCS